MARGVGAREKGLTGIRSGAARIPVSLQLLALGVVSVWAPGGWPAESLAAKFRSWQAPSRLEKWGVDGRLEIPRSTFRRGNSGYRKRGRLNSSPISNRLPPQRGSLPWRPHPDGCQRVERSTRVSQIARVERCILRQAEKPYLPRKRMGSSPGGAAVPVQAQRPLGGRVPIEWKLQCGACSCDSPFLSVAGSQRNSLPFSWRLALIQCREMYRTLA